MGGFGSRELCIGSHLCEVPWNMANNANNANSAAKQNSQYRETEWRIPRNRMARGLTSSYNRPGCRAEGLTDSGARSTESVLLAATHYAAAAISGGKGGTFDHKPGFQRDHMYSFPFVSLMVNFPQYLQIIDWPERLVSRIQKKE